MGRDHKAQNESFLTGSVFLRVQKAKKRDMGRNVIRLDPEVMEEIKITDKDFSKAIEVVSKIVNMRLNLEHKKEVN